MKFQNKGAVLVQIAHLFISQPRNQNQSIGYIKINSLLKSFRTNILVGNGPEIFKKSDLTPVAGLL